MTLESTFDLLQTRLRQLDDLFAALGVTVVEDRPLERVLARGGVDGPAAAPVERAGDKVIEVHGWITGAVEAATECRGAVAPPIDVDGARRALAACHEKFSRAAQEFWCELVSYERIAELTEFGRDRGGESRAWSKGVVVALEQCRGPINDVNETLLLCWQELAERLGVNGTSIQNTTIGQSVRSVPLQRPQARSIGR